MQKEYGVYCATDGSGAGGTPGGHQETPGTSQKVKRAPVLLKADAEGPSWTEERITEAFCGRTRTVELIRQRLVERGFEETAQRATTPIANRSLPSE